jgi:hypothetical protein
MKPIQRDSEAMNGKSLIAETRNRHTGNYLISLNESLRAGGFARFGWPLATLFDVSVATSTS